MGVVGKNTNRRNIQQQSCHREFLARLCNGPWNGSHLYSSPIPHRKGQAQDKARKPFSHHETHEIHEIKKAKYFSQTFRVFVPSCEIFKHLLLEILIRLFPAHQFELHSAFTPSLIALAGRLLGWHSISRVLCVFRGFSFGFPAQARKPFFHHETHEIHEIVENFIGFHTYLFGVGRMLVWPSTFRVFCVFRGFTFGFRVQTSQLQRKNRPRPHHSHRKLFAFVADCCFFVAKKGNNFYLLCVFQKSPPTRMHRRTESVRTKRR